MSLFQNSVLQNYLKRQDKELISKLYSRYKKYFHNPKTQENIRASKEEQFQEGFLRELFVKILGYTINPDTNFNITTEFKNLSNAQKADGAILVDGKATAVIELKGTKTKDFKKIEAQAFGYKNAQSDCVYVITSNFERLRFYIDNTVEYEEFNLFTMSLEEFELFYLCLAKENLLTNLAQNIKNESLVSEKKITNKLYNDYSNFKREMYRDLVKQNMKNEVFRTELDSLASSEESDRATKNIKLTLFKKSQKLIDRFLFIFFAEDRGLIPANSTLEILEQWQKLKAEFDIDEPLYNRFKNYFNYLDTGRKATATNKEIFAYNGGLFKTDKVLDSLTIDNELLYEHTKKLSEYDFDSQVGVSVLGHIFENSLNEIESVNAEIEGVAFDKQKSKRKKDGVFYTPQYITRYIVESTVGKLCTEKKTELLIVDEEYYKGRKGRLIKTVEILIEKLTTYRNWLLELTILDPACGSGAFLNEAMEFLIREHRYIDELQSAFYGDAMVLSNIENTILENNIFGVDLNEESVEIAKLSLWLRSAQPRRKLNDLNSNIKCGNSLISSKSVAGDKAFVWEDEFPQIFTEKKKKIWHITTATHNSRYSQRMFDYHINKGESRWLSEKDEMIITETLSEIVKKDSLNIPAYNICGDHMHLMLVCEESEVSKIVGKIKAMTARACNITMGHTNIIADNANNETTNNETTNNTKARGHAPLSIKAKAKAESVSISKEESRGVTQTHLWTQKFGKKEIFDNEQYSNTIQYIRNNRKKHELPENKELQKIVASFVCHIKDAMKVEYSGGFDVVIGNPPYGIFIDNVEEKYYKKNFPNSRYKLNLYTMFIEQIFYVFGGSVVHFIIPKSLLENSFFEELRKQLLTQSKIYEIFLLTEKVFEDAEVGGSLLIKFQAEKNNNLKNKIRIVSTDTYANYENSSCLKNDVEQEYFLDIPHCEIAPVKADSISILKKLRKLEPISNYYSLKNGLNPGNVKEILISDKKETDLHRKIIWGKEFNQYTSNWGGQYINYDPTIIERLTLNDIKSKEGMKAQTKIDFALRSKELFETEKIIFRKTGDRFIAFKDTDNFYFDTLVHGLYKINELFDLNFLLALLNSTPATQFYRLLHDIKGKVFAKISLIKLGAFPIPKSTIEDREKLGLLACDRTMQTSKLYAVNSSFTTYLLSQHPTQKLPKKLQNWHTLSFADFIKELNKLIVLQNKGACPLVSAGALREKKKLTKLDEMEWMEVFEAKKLEALAIKSEIEKIDNEIDEMVFDLYGLDEDERAIVRGNDK